MGDPRIDRIAARQAAQTAATRLTVTPPMADTAAMSDEQVGKLTALFDVFDPDSHAYSVGDVASYDGVLYRVVMSRAGASLFGDGRMVGLAVFPGEVSDADAARLAAAT